MSFDLYAFEIAGRLTSEPLQARASGRVGLSPEALFDLVTDVDALASWLPLARRTWSDDAQAEAPQRVGAVRMIDSGFGPPAEERVVFFERPRVYAYRASDRSLRGLATDHLSVIGVEAHPNGGSVLTWLSFAKPPRSRLVALIGEKVFGYVLRGGVRNLERRYPVRS
jgi:hypothetical protein